MAFLKKLSLFKIIGIVVLSILFFGGAGGYFYFKKAFKVLPSELKTEQTSAVIPFQWQADSIGNELNPHAAMLLPISIPGCERIFYAQFDLGAPTSILYEKKIEAINDRYHNFSIHEKDGLRSVSNFKFQAGDLELLAGKISLKNFSNTGIDWSDSTSIEIIGTIGSDLIDEKALIIDYPNQKITLSNSLADSIQNTTTLKNFEWEERRILLPATINGNETILYFDTGSSAFELLTSKSNFEELRKPGGEIERFGVNSWGNTLWAHTSSTEHSAVIANTSVPIKKITYIDGTSFVQNLLMRFSGMGGMTGNKLFIDRVLIIDTKRQVFGFYNH